MTRETVVLDFENPQESSIEYVSPMEMAPAPGIVLATAVEDSVTTMAWR
jgi:hypothetical protein